jgi:hypothetical protein
VTSTEQYILHPPEITLEMVATKKIKATHTIFVPADTPSQVLLPVTERYACLINALSDCMAVHRASVTQTLCIPHPKAKAQTPPSATTYSTPDAPASLAINPLHFVQEAITISVTVGRDKKISHWFGIPVGTSQRVLVPLALYYAELARQGTGLYLRKVTISHHLKREPEQRTYRHKRAMITLRTDGPGRNACLIVPGVYDRRIQQSRTFALNRDLGEVSAYLDTLVNGILIADIRVQFCERRGERFIAVVDAYRQNAFREGK